MLAGGGKWCADMEWLRVRPGPFAPVPSDATLWRTLAAIDEATPDYLGQSMAAARTRVWRRSSATTGTAPAVSVLDATIVQLPVEIPAGHRDGDDAAVAIRGGPGRPGGPGVGRRGRVLDPLGRSVPVPQPRFLGGRPLEPPDSRRGGLHPPGRRPALFKAPGLERFLFRALAADRARMAVVCFATDLVRWFQLLCLADLSAALMHE